MHYKPRIRYFEGKIHAEVSFNRGWIDDIKRTVPAHKRSWDTAVSIWSFDAAYYQCVLHVTQVHFGLEIVDATGGVGEPQDMAWKAKLDAHIYGKEEGKAFLRQITKYETPRSVLFVTDDAPDYIITAAYRALAARNHPDKGGTEAAMQRINAAYEALK